MSTKARFNRIPRYSMGGFDISSIMGGGGGGDMMGSGIVDTFNTKIAEQDPGYGQGAAMGGAVGSAFGPIGKMVGSTIGGMLGGIAMSGETRRAIPQRLIDERKTGANQLANLTTNNYNRFPINGYPNYIYARGGKLRVRGEEELTNYTPQEFGTRSSHEMYVSPYTLLKYLFPRRKKYDKGGKVEPIYTNNPNDPRLQAYNYQLPSDITESRSIIHNNGYKGGLGTGKETIKEIGLLGDAISFYPNPYAQGAGYLMSLPSTALSIYDKPTDPTSYLGLIPNAPLKVASKTIKAASRLNTFLNAANLGIDYEDLNKKALGGSINSNKKYFDNTGKPYEIFADGGKIHIKPENRGKFTASAKAHHMGVQAYASHVLADPHASATMKKRANFARNAAKWHHGDGSPLEQIEDGPNVHPTLGGKLIPLNDEASLVVGDNHGQDSDNDGNEGVTMINPETGQPYAEVENGEVITSDNDVISDRIKLPDGRSVAEAFIPLQTEEGKLKKKIEKGGNIYKVNHYKRDLQDIQAQEQQLLDYSESMRERYANMPNKMAMGGKLRKYALGQDGQFLVPTDDNEYDNEYYDGNSNPYQTPKIGFQSILNDVNSSNDNQYAPAPATKPANNKFLTGLQNGIGNATGFISNIYNAIANNKVKPLPNPSTYNIANLKTTYNVNPQLNAIDSETKSMDKYINNNTSNGVTARVNRIGNSARRIAAYNQVLANKENIETGLINQAAMNGQQIGNQNIDLVNQNKKDIWNLDKYKLDETSRNLTEIEYKLQQMDRDKRQNQLDYTKIATDLLGKSNDSYSMLMGTDAFDESVKSNPALKASLYKYVSRQGNEKLLQRFIDLYGKVE